MTLISRLCRRAACGLLCAAAMLLSSCNIIQLNVEELLHPPRLTEEQNEIFSVLESAVGQNPKLKYPKSGEYLSAFVMYDLDNDKEEEAMVFYESTEGGGSTRINILDNIGGKWYSINDSPGGESDIHMVRFVNLSRQEGKEIVIGWENETGDTKILQVYRFTGGKMEPVFKGEPYSDFAVFDFRRNGLDEIVLLESGINTELEYDAKLISCDDFGNIMVASQYKMTMSYEQFVQVQNGKLANGATALFIDGYLTGASRREFLNKSALYPDRPALYSEGPLMCTEVLYLTPEGELSSRLLYENDDYAENTVRDTYVHCLDVNRDGIMEIPMPQVMQGYEGSSEEERMYVTEFCSLDDVGIRNVIYAVVNLDEGYLLRLPKAWENKVTVTQQPKSREWRFWVYTGSLNTLSEELLRIKVYSKNDYHDKFESDTYQLLATKGIFEYYAYIPPTVSKDYATTYDQLKELFTLL